MLPITKGRCPNEMKSVTISQDLCHIVAKAGRNNEQKWLPLWMHACDTAEVMKYLIREWLPESVAKLLEKAIIQQKKVSINDVEKLGVFLGYIHDFGKANSYFQCLITKNIPERLAQIKEDGTSVLAWESYEKKDAITLMLAKHFFGHMDIQKELHQLWDLIME